MTTHTTDIQNEIFDIIFIGAGPVAMYGMYYAGLRMTKFKAIDMLEEVGGGLMALYPEKYIYDVGGFPKVLAKELTRQLEIQATQYPHGLCLGEKVIHIIRGDDGIITITTTKGIHFGRTVIICAGLGAYIPKRLDIPNVQELEGSGVYYAVRKISDFHDKNVLVVGGGDSAFDYSMMLEPVAASITHIHRNDFFSAHEDSVRKVMNSSVRLKVPFWEVKQIVGDTWVREATIVQTRTGEEEILPVDAIIFNTGFLTNLGPIADWGLELEKNAIKVDSRMRTNIEGIYAAGDIVTYDGKLKLISTGFGEVAIAVNNAKHHIDPKAKVNPGHSTDKHEAVMKKLSAPKSISTVEPVEQTPKVEKRVEEI
ncbi:MAG: NAD(P)/FAD-dependent oxidoreductase [candidate division Zixibacteria bacterium]|nr:NAD(P)/FAD-dependent oxidoreductase [candidate division Zixibacteria bacterium]